MTDAELAHRLAEAAGRILLELRASSVLEGRALGDAGDATAHQFLTHALRHARPDDGLLSEEGAADPARLEKRRVWIVDPLDGTREFSERRPDWAVHVALVIDGVAVTGAVAQPDMGVTHSSAGPCVGLCGGDPLRLVVSRTRPPAEAERAAKVLGAELVPMGSAGAKAMAVVRGEAHAYVHSGGQYEWDSAAPAAVAAAAGLHVSRIDGSPLVYNRADPYLPDLIVCRPELSERLLAAVR
jgi:3'(2'), 5'-bisphosphate nucleotidase